MKDGAVVGDLVGGNEARDSRRLVQAGVGGQGGRERAKDAKNNAEKTDWGKNDALRLLSTCHSRESRKPVSQPLKA
jgi:hypothetical protein